MYNFDWFTIMSIAVWRKCTMKFRAFAVVLMMLFVLLSGVSYSAVELAGSFRIDDGVTLYLPDDWTEISREQLDEMSSLITSNLGISSPRYNYGYQLKGTEPFKYPYMLVIINNTGRIRESEFSNIKKVTKELESAYDSAEKEMKSIIDNVSLGEQVYDEDGKRLISKAVTDVAGVGSVVMVVDMQLTSRGFVQFMFYCTESQYPKYGEIFSQIINGVEVTGDAMYSSTGANQKTGTKAAGTDNASGDTSTASEKSDTASMGSDTASAQGDRATGEDAAYGSSSVGAMPINVDVYGLVNNFRDSAVFVPALIAVIILVIGIILFVIIRSGSKRKNANNAGRSGYTDWFCPKCRHGNSASTSVCQNCKHSIL